MQGGSIFLGIVAGVLSTLSPCVVPLLPLVVGGAASAHRYGPLALAAGLAVSFTTVGLFIATIGFAVGLDAEVFRIASAVLLAAIGLVLLSGGLQQRFAVAGGGVADAGNRLLARMTMPALAGQFCVGAVLGAVWSPCVGPTLGAASVLAAQSRDLANVAAVMVAFGLGAAAPLALVGVLSRSAMLRWRGRMAGTGQFGRTLMGMAALAVALLVLTGADHRLETWLVSLTPGWLTDLTTRF